MTCDAKGAPFSGVCVNESQYLSKDLTCGLHGGIIAEGRSV